MRQAEAVAGSSNAVLAGPSLGEPPGLSDISVTRYDLLKTPGWGNWRLFKVNLPSTSLKPGDAASNGTSLPDVPLEEESPPSGMLAAILEGLHQACLLLDSSDRILFGNEAAKRLFMPKGRLLGRRLETVLADRQLSQLVAECLAARRPATLTFALRLPGEAWRDDRHFLADATPFTLPSGHWLVRLALSPDQPAETAGRAATNPAEEVLCQLRGPLTVVQGYLENLLDGLITDPVALRQSLLTMRRSSLQMERLLEAFRQ